MRLAVSTLIVSMIIALTTGCSGTFSHRSKLNPSEPLRVAVLPFLHGDTDAEKGETALPTGNLLIDGVNPLASAPTDVPTRIVRQLVEERLSATSLQLINPAVVEIELAHRGLVNAEGMFMLRQIHSLSAEELCEEVFECDAVLYGKVTEWERSYYGIESVASVGVEMSLRSARSGEEIFYVTGRDTERRGVSGGPTGFSDLVLEPIRGLDAETIEDLAHQVVGESLEPIVEGGAKNGMGASPPSLFSAAHDAPDNLLQPGEPLLVLAYAQSKLSAAFSLGNSVKRVPMAEKSPGHYVGIFFPLPSDKFKDEALVIALTDRYGRESVFEIPGSEVTVVGE